MRCLTLKECIHLLQTHIDKLGNTKLVVLPHKCLHCLHALKEEDPLFPEALQLQAFKDKMFSSPNVLVAQRRQSLSNLGTRGLAQGHDPASLGRQ